MRSFLGLWICRSGVIPVLGRRNRTALNDRLPGARTTFVGALTARPGGFTLLEVLLVLALIGLLSTVLISGGAHLLSTQPNSADDLFWAAVQEARKDALKSDTEVVMKFVDDKDQGKEFVISNGGTTKTFPIPKAGDLEVTFLSQQKGGNLIMVAGTLLETQKIETVSFYPDGTCSPFRVQFFHNGAVHTASIDPWTCAPMLMPGDTNTLEPQS